MGGLSTSACPGCGEKVSPEDGFCEACGRDLSAITVSVGEPGHVAACPVCGSRVGTDGYCEECGRKAPSGRDHVELDNGMLAGITDRGLRHRRNEDAMAIAAAETPAGPAAVAVVCDGVSTSARADEAALAAVEAAARALVASLRAETSSRDAEREAEPEAEPEAEREAEREAASAAAVRAANDAVVGLAVPADDPPSATYVSAVATNDAVTVCWVGDSRVYWLPAGSRAGARQLTRDDSMAEELTADGSLSASEALASPQAHVITRWLGADVGELVPHVMTLRPTEPGVVLLCSDGLWNYRPEAADLASLALPAAFTDPLAAAASLVTCALDAGGRDNITVVLIPVPLGRRTAAAGARDGAPGHRAAATSQVKPRSASP